MAGLPAVSNCEDTVVGALKGGRRFNAAAKSPETAQNYEAILTRSLLVGLAGVVIIVAALGLNFWLNRDASQDVAASGDADTPRVVAEEPPETPAATSEPSQAATATAAASRQDQGGSVPAGVQTDTDAAQTEQSTAESNAAATAQPPPAETAARDEDAPAFDVVRLSRKGDSVMAGRGKPGTTVDILSDDETIGSAEVDDRGEWVFVPTTPLEPGSHELSLRATEEDSEAPPVESDHVVVLVVPKAGENIAGQPSREESEPLALLVPSDGTPGETKVLQKPTTVPGGVEAETGDLALDIVDYDQEGSLALTGRGKPNASVRVYLDNDFVGEAPVDDKGFWRATPDEGVDPGVYDLRVDQVVDETVVARLELPFSRAEPITSLRDEQLVIVQPGNSLWRIARRTLGEGMAFSVIYDANKNQIRDPDLIYPGQIFQVPKRAVN